MVSDSAAGTLQMHGAPGTDLTALGLRREDDPTCEAERATAFTARGEISRTSQPSETSAAVTTSVLDASTIPAPGQAAPTLRTSGAPGPTPSARTHRRSIAVRRSLHAPGLAPLRLQTALLGPRQHAISPSVASARDIVRIDAGWTSASTSLLERARSTQPRQPPQLGPRPHHLHVPGLSNIISAVSSAARPPDLLDHIVTLFRPASTLAWPSHTSLGA
ncbi:hypothetical protein V8E36_004251 [Tilletia maclaganii]